MDGIGNVQEAGGLENVTKKNGLRSVTGIRKKERITKEMVEKYFHVVELWAPSYAHIVSGKCEHLYADDNHLFTTGTDIQLIK